MRTAGAGVGGNYGSRLTYAISTANYWEGPGAGRSSVADIPVVAGIAVVPSMYVSSNASKAVQLIVTFYNSSGTFLSENPDLGVTTICEYCASSFWRVLR